MHPEKKAFAVVRFSGGKQSAIKLYAAGAQKDSNIPNNNRHEQTDVNVYAKAIPSEVKDQKIAAPPSKYLLVKQSENEPAKSTSVPNTKLKSGPATQPYFSSLKFGIASRISYLLTLTYESLSGKVKQ